jgi:uncharacterized membrane protein YcaP (DUF421 family)
MHQIKYAVLERSGEISFFRNQCHNRVPPRTDGMLATALF